MKFPAKSDPSGSNIFDHIGHENTQSPEGVEGDVKQKIIAGCNLAASVNVYLQFFFSDWWAWRHLALSHKQIHDWNIQADMR